MRVECVLSQLSYRRLNTHFKRHHVGTWFLNACVLLIIFDRDGVLSLAKGLLKFVGGLCIGGTCFRIRAADGEHSAVLLFRVSCKRVDGDSKAGE